MSADRRQSFQMPTVSDLVFFVGRHWWVALLVFVAGAAASITAATTVRNGYLSVAEIRLIGAHEAQIGWTGGGAETPVAAEYIWLITHLLKDRSTISPLVDKYESSLLPRERKQRARVAARIADKLEIRTSNRGAFDIRCSIGVTATTPTAAKNIAHGLALFAMNWHRQRFLHETAQFAAVARAQLAQISAAITESERKMAAFLKRHPSLRVSRQEIERLNVEGGDRLRTAGGHGARFRSVEQPRRTAVDPPARASTGPASPTADGALLEAQWSRLRRRHRRLTVQHQDFQEVFVNAQVKKELQFHEVKKTATLTRPATLPTAPGGPSHTLIIAGGSLVALLMGLALAALMGVVDPRLHRPEQITQLAPGFDVLALLQNHGNGSSAEVSATAVSSHPSAPDLRVVSPPADATFAADLFMARDPMGKAAEQMRLLAARVRSALGSDLRVITVASWESQTGKSTIAANLALALAEQKKSVLLVDASPCTAALTGMFGLEVSVGGLCEQLQRRLERRASCWHVIQVAENLCVMPSVPDVETPVMPLLLSEAFSRLVGDMSRIYDAIVIDTEALERVSDAIVLRRLVDGYLVVARRRRSTTTTLQAITSRVAQDSVLGVVFNEHA